MSHFHNPPKPKPCRVCREKFTPQRPLQVTCSPTCAMTYGSANNRALLDRARKVERAERVKEKRAWRAKTDSLGKLKNRAQTAFNRYIRLRDEGQPCICCGELANEKDFITGGSYDAGHYRTRGAADHLRYNEDNCHLQRKSCNMGNSGRSQYRARLIQKIGLERVEALENDNRVVKWERDQLIAIANEYKSKWRALKAEREGR